MGMAGAAGKRWLRGAGLSYVEQGVTILGDDPYCKKHWDGTQRLTWHYRFANGVPIKDGADALRLNWMALVILDAEGTQRSRHVFLTNRELTRDKVAAYIDAGRARWTKQERTE